MQRSSLLLGTVGAVAALLVTSGLVAGGYFAGRGVMASRIGDPIVTVGIAQIETAAGPVYAMPAVATACEAERTARRIEQRLQRIIQLLEETGFDRGPAAI